MEAYLQHGQAGEPMRTEAVPVEHRSLGWHLAGLSWTASGYGARIATPYMVKVEGRWRRVYRYQYANQPSHFIGPSLKEGTLVTIS